MSNERITKLFEDISNHLLEDEKPSVYICNLLAMGELLQYPFSFLARMKDTEQSPKYHPEGSVWNHTMMVVDEAAKVRCRSKKPDIFMWSALLHDIGKPSTTRIRKGKISSYDHDIEGEKLCMEFLNCFSLQDDFIQSVAAMVRYHMHILYVLKNLPYADWKGLRKRVDAGEIALLCLCDRLGRTGVDTQIENEEYHKFVEILQKDTKK